MRNVLAVVGAQWGSEGKGVIVSHLADEYQIHVRTGGANAGHSFYHPAYGIIFKMQVVPVGWCNPNATLIIGRGALIDEDLLDQEVSMIEKLEPNFRERLIIDEGAGLVDDRHKLSEGGVEGPLHQRIGSTGKGVGAARMDRMRRNPDVFRTAKSGELDKKYQLHPFTPDLLRPQPAINVLLEGTQGCGLSLIHGDWPYVTSHDTNAATLAADAGIPPNHVNQRLLVARSYPIRVAGNSGPLPNEISWDDLSEELGRPVVERTTVTDKIRRVAHWNDEIFQRAVRLNDPTSVALTFADYIDVNNEGAEKEHELTLGTRRFIEYLEVLGAPVSMIGTGGMPWKVIRRKRL